MEGTLLETVGLLVVVFLIVRLLSEYYHGGVRSLLTAATLLVRQLPGANYILSSYIEKEVVGFVQQLYSENDGKRRSDLLSIPEKGTYTLVPELC